MKFTKRKRDYFNSKTKLHDLCAHLKKLFAYKLSTKSSLKEQVEKHYRNFVFLCMKHQLVMIGKQLRSSMTNPKSWYDLLSLKFLDTISCCSVGIKHQVE